MGFAGDKQEKGSLRKINLELIILNHFYYTELSLQVFNVAGFVFFN